jgi:hypothetical protein
MTEQEVDALGPGDTIYSTRSGKRREVVMVRKSGSKVIAVELVPVATPRFGCSTAAVERWSLKNRYRRKP